MVERGHQLMYVCFNNEAYMNTGIQRSGATGFGASTTTSPAGKEVPGKTEHPKDLTMIMAAHDIPYTAQVSPYYWRDLIAKAEKGFECGGPAFLNAISPCPRGWRFNSEDGMILAKLAVETCVWPLYEYENGKYSLTSESKRIAEGKSEKKPITEWFKAQGRYKHMLAEGNEELVAKVQAEIDRKWERLIALTKL
jgi:pyruvate ferredoxin oxidoreductase beta subunit